MNVVHDFVHCDPIGFLRLVDFDGEALADLSGMFVAGAGEQVEAIRHAANTGNATAVRDLTHALKGSLAIFHAVPALARVDDLERALRGPPGVSFAPLAARLADEVDALCAELSHWVVQDARAQSVLACALAAEVGAPVPSSTVPDGAAG